jgi:uncharacterized protein YbcV (DUF1398 family)
MNESDLQKVYQQAREKKWKYPQLFDALKGIGVECYEVDVPFNKISYLGGATTIVHPSPDGFQRLAVGPFNAAAFKAALTRAQNQETTYPEFLKEIAAASIAFYRVDMEMRSVTYFGKDRTQQIVEPVPPAH